MPWLTPRACLAYASLEKVSKLTNATREKAYVGEGDGIETAFELPFFGGSQPKVYVSGSEVTTDITKTETGTNDRWLATFTSPPADGAKIEAASTDGVNAVVLEAKLLAAQAAIRGYINASPRFSAPADDATVGEPVRGWSWDVAAYYLATDFRHAGLLDTYPGIADRYADLTGGGPGAAGRPSSFVPILRDVAKGGFDLTGTTGVGGKTGSMSETDPYITSSYGSEGDRVFGPPE